MLKQPYKGRSIALKDSQGEIVNSLKQADTFAEYLANSHWKAPDTTYTGNSTVIHPNNPVNMQPITHRELRSILKAVKNNKAPGPDDIPAEVFKWLDTDTQTHLLFLFNQILSTGKIPSEWKKATVVEIYKGKGSHTDPEMYRPISLLPTAYKIFARILQKRLEEAVDRHIRPTQFGFRRNRSTSQPIHIVRRLIESAESHDQPLYTLFLDWEKAFDKIHPQALITSLHRFGLNTAFTDIIKDIYTNPAFTVRAMNHQSTEHIAGSGIRQGCPLSPYLIPLHQPHHMYEVVHLGDAEVFQILPNTFRVPQKFHVQSYSGSHLTQNLGK